MQRNTAYRPRSYPSTWKPSAFTFESLATSYPEPDGLVSAFEFGTPGDVENFTEQQVNDLRSVGGLLFGTAAGTGAWIESPGVTIPASRVRRIEIKLASTSPTARFYFTTAADANWTEDKAMDLSLTADYQPYVYLLDPRADATVAPHWTGTITKFRIALDDGQEFALDHVRFW